VTNQPKFRIRTVAEMTGVQPVTLRAWERRYGFPRPVRSNSSYRLYTSGDVQQIRRMRQLCESGMAASEAAAMVRSGKPAVAPLIGSPSDAFTEGVDELLDALHAMDVEHMNRVMTRAASWGSASQIFERMIAPVMVKVGERWRAGRLSVAHEHLVTEFFQTTLTQMLRLVQPASPRHTAVLACFPDELHTLPLYGVGFELVNWGCRTVVLGQRTPAAGLASALQSLRPSLVALSVTVQLRAAKAREALEGYAGACGRVPWLVGGAGALALADQVRELGGVVAPPGRDGWRPILERVFASGDRRRGTRS